MIPRTVKICLLVLTFVIVAGGSAYLTLSLIIRSEDTVIVPDLVGKDAIVVLEMLTGLGLNAKTRDSEFSSNHPKNQVIYQDPEPGSEIKMGRDVELIVSKGSRAIQTPNVTQQVVRQAKLLLEGYGLCQGELTFAHAEEAEKNQVLSQFPTPGSVIAREGCVDLLVSLGKRPRALLMPNVNDLSLEDAILAVEMNDLVLGKVTPRFHEERPSGIIVGQTPLPGHRVVAGTTVHLVRNRRPDGKEPVADDLRATGHLFRYRLESGFLKRHVHVKLNVFEVLDDLYDAFVKPGQEVWMIIPRGENVEVSLYVDDELIKRETYDVW